MKKYIISSLLILGVLSIYITGSIVLGACSSDGGNIEKEVLPEDSGSGGVKGGPFALFRAGEKGGIDIEMKTKSKSINGNAMKAGESYSKEYSLNLGKTFEEEYGIDPNTVASFYIDSVVVKWTSTNICSKLASYTIKIEYPDFVAFNENNTVVNTKTIERNNVSFPCKSSSNDIVVFKDADFKQAVIDAGDKPIDFKGDDDKKLQYEMLTTNFAKAIKENKAIKVKLDMKTNEAFEANSGITIEIKSRIRILKLIEGEINVPVKEDIVIEPKIQFQPKQTFVLNTASVAEKLGPSFDIKNLKTAVIDHLVISSETELLPITGEVQIFAPIDFYPGDNIPRKETDYKKFVKFGFWSRPVKPNRTDIIKLIKDKTPISMELGTIRSFSSTPIKVKLMANIKYTLYK